MSVRLGNWEEKVSATRSQAEATSLGSGCTNTLRRAAATMSAEALGTFASTLQVKCTRKRCQLAPFRLRRTALGGPVVGVGEDQAHPAEARVAQRE
jgi:hypothetical protein